MKKKDLTFLGTIYGHNLCVECKDESTLEMIKDWLGKIGEHSDVFDRYVTKKDFLKTLKEYGWEDVKKALEKSKEDFKKRKTVSHKRVMELLS